MQINFNVPFLGFDGRPMTESGKPKTISSIVALSLFSGSEIKPTGDPDRDLRNKLVAYDLCQRIYGATDAVEITSEEAVLIKQAVVGINSAGAYAQIINLIEH